MSRRPRAELQFGSDSFLDVVANIVGILIILIVIAGLKVSQTPVLIQRPSVVAIEEPAEQISVVVVEEEPGLEPLFLAEAEEVNPAPVAVFVTAAPVVREAQAEADAPSALDAQVDALSNELKQLERSYRAAAEQTAAAREAESAVNERWSQLNVEVASREKEARSVARNVEVQHTSFAQLQATADQLRKQIAAEERKQPDIKPLEHRVTPLSKVVSGNEQHYRLAGNRVSEVPITALSLRLRDQIERRKDWLLKQRSHQGTVGPLGGYSMHYLVQRDNLGVLDEVRYGQGMVRISVSQWRIEPESGLPAESASEALTPGSRFYESLLAAEEGASLTFWVYPDSYALYRQLQRFAHEQGFLVAGRPLPHGIPISGSPNGTKSAGQ